MTTYDQTTNVQPARGKSGRVLVWQVLRNPWRYTWTLKAANGHVIAESNTFYVREAAAYAAALRVIALLRGDVIIERRDGADRVDVLVPGGR